MDTHLIFNQAGDLVGVTHCELQAQLYQAEGRQVSMFADECALADYAEDILLLEEGAR